MLPNLQMKPLEIFGLELHAFGFLVGLAIVLGTVLAGRRARQIGLSERVVADVAIWAVVCGFIGAHFYSAIFYFPEKIAEDPIYLFKLWDGISSFGGFIGGALGVFAYFRRNKELPFLPYADAIIYGFAFAWIFGRMGCTTAFDHPGLITDFFLGMEFLGTKELSAGVRHNLGMYEMFWAIAMAAFFFANRNKTRFKGWYLMTFVVAYMPFRFMLDFLREIDLRHFGLTAAQWGGIVLFGLGVWLLVRGVKKGDLLVPDGQPKHWPKKELAALERRSAGVTAAPARVGGGGSSKKKKR